MGSFRVRKLSDITIHLPSEHFIDLSEVLSVGLQRAKIAPQTRKELMQWWEAEKDFIVEDLASDASE
jgi:hypothetical protein